MKTNFLAVSHNQILVQRNLFLCVATISMAVNLLLAGINFYLVGKERIVITPAVLTNQFWVSGKGVSESYLEQMASFFVGLVLNISPNSFSSQCQQLLQHVHPSAYPAVKAQFVVQQTEIERRAMSTSFHPIYFKVDREKLLVEIKGELRIMMGGLPLELKTTCYQIQFIHEHGRLYIKQFKEVKNEG